jgi:hypothetical protein
LKISAIIFCFGFFLSIPNAQCMTVGTQFFSINEEPITEVQQQRFNSLTSAQQNRFRKIHLEFLQKAAVALTWNKLTLGYGSVVKDKVSQFYHSNDIPNPILNFVEEASVVEAPPTVRQRGHNAIQFILSGLDTFMWDHVAVLSDAKEFGVSGMLGLEAGYKAADMGQCTGCALGASLVYNPKNEELTFDFFTDMESVDEAYPFIAQVSIFGRFMGFASSVDTSNPSNPLKLRVISPVGFVASMDAPTHIGLGVELGVGFPTLDAIASYKSTVTRRTLVKKTFGIPSMCGSFLRWLKMGRVQGHL